MSEFSYLVHVAPVFIFVLGLVFYFKLPRFRGDVGLICASLGVIGVFLYSVTIYIVSVVNGEILVLVAVLIFEMATVFLGLFSWKNRLREKKD